MTKWEYKILVLDIHLSAILTLARWEIEISKTEKVKEFQNIEAYINKLGNEGWELTASVSGTDNHGNITKAILFFKRPLKGSD